MRGRERARDRGRGERERLGERGELLDWTVLRCSAPVMAENSEKVPIASAGPEDLHQFMPPVSSGQTQTAAISERHTVILLAVMLLP